MPGTTVRPAGRAHQRDADEHVGVGLGDVEGAAVVQQRGEGVVDRLDDAGLDQGPRHVRPAHHAAAGALDDVAPGDRVAGVGEGGHDPLAAAEPLVAQPGPLRRQRRVPGVEEVGQQVHADRRRSRGEPAAGQLHARDDGQPVGPGPLRLGPPCGGVVVGERDDVQPGTDGGGEQLGRCVGAVGDRGVGVQVDPHQRPACPTVTAGAVAGPESARCPGGHHRRPAGGGRTAVRDCPRRHRSMRRHLRCCPSRC